MSILMRLRSMRIGLGLVILCLSIVTIEIAARMYFAATMSSDVLLYGVVESPTNALFDPKGEILRWDQKFANTAIHDNVGDNYSKYFPNQHRIHPDEAGKQIAATINSHGFRGRDFARTKASGVIRIVTLGASSTFGFKTRDDQSYPYYLEERLNNERPGKYEVINLGIPHLHSDQIYSLFMAEAVPLEPDLVTFYEGFVDASSSSRDSKALVAVKAVPRVTTVFRELRHRLLSVALFADKAFGRRYPAADAKFRVFQGEADEKRKRFIDSLDSIYKECHRRGIVFIAMTQQAKSLHVERDKIQGVSYEDEIAQLHAELANGGGVYDLEKSLLIHNDLMAAERLWAKSNDVPLVDVIEAMNANRQYLIDWMHLSAQGNLVVAATLSEKILALTQ